jgi:hypothetical protein
MSTMNRDRAGAVRHRFRLLALLAALAVTALPAAACGDSDDAAESSDGGGDTLRVPQDHETIQEAVDEADPGDLVLVDAGTYEEAVDVTTENITIRGVDRNEVILDGGFELENGIRVLDTDGVVVENMTARNYVSNGFYWTGSDYYRGSYLTAYRNGDYGIYSFDAYHGQFDHSLGWGSPDAGFYIGECYPCDAVIDTVDSQYNGLGYSGTNSGGDLYIVNSVFANNRAGVVPNSGSYELCYPSRETTVAGNVVHDNNYMDGPGIDVSLLAQGNGILLAGAVRADVSKNLVYSHDRTGIGLVPFPEDDANDLAPGQDEWDTPCSETRDEEVQPIPEDQCTPVEIIGEGCVVVWNPFENSVEGNDVSGSGVADLAVGTVDLTQSGETTDTLRNCFSGNTFTTSAPAQLEALAPCEGSPTATDWAANELNLLTLLGDMPPAPPKDAWKTTPEPPAQESMPDASTAPHEEFTGPEAVDLESITVPTKPS